MAETREPSPFRLTPPPSSGALGRRFLTPAYRAVERVLGLHHLHAIYDGRPLGCTSEEFLSYALDALDTHVRVSAGDLARIPESGACIVVANHPFGGVEGIALARLLRERRPDVKVMANYVLGCMPELHEPMLFVDPFARPTSVGSNLGAMREALRWLKGGGMLAVFPAGEVAHLNIARRRIEDPPWSTTVSGLVRRARCPALPIYFAGRNSVAFQLAGLLHPRLRTLMLGRQMVARRGRPIEARIGSAIPFRKLADQGSDADVIGYLRERTEILRARRNTGPVQPRITPADAQPIVVARPARILAAEVDALSDEQHLVNAGDQSVYVARAEQIPELLREIGRLREITFREVGEGTGREIDLDDFDDDYHHLFLWNREPGELVGAYRLGLTDELLRDRGLAGLYTSTLFNFDRQLLESMGPAVEMGRSFIRPEYQKSYTGLLLLWKGIGQFVMRQPRYATLFGPVSISADYQSASQRMIVAFLKQNRFAHDWSRWVRPRSPLSAPRARGLRLGPACLRDLDDVSSFISEIEADGKGVPVLLKQYLKLGGRLLGFNVDPEFSHVLDVLIMVDLCSTDRKTLNRYMGRDGAHRFLTHPREIRSEAS